MVEDSRSEIIYKGEKPNIEKIGKFYDNSWALIVGIDDYGGNYRNLTNAVNDAKDLENIFKNKYKFENTILLKNDSATRSSILNYLQNELPEKISSNDRFIFYFSGHGFTREVKEKNIKLGYIIPYGANPKDGKGNYPYWDYIKMSEITEACALINAKHIFLMLDSCFSGIAALKGSPIHQGKIDETVLKTFTQKKAFQVLTAGDSDEYVRDSSLYSGHSPFTGALLEGLDGSADRDNDYIITATDLGDYVRIKVISETNRYGAKGQTPISDYLPGSEKAGNLVFLLPGYGSEKKVPTDIFEMMNKEDYPSHISKRIFLVHEWKEEPGVVGEYQKWYNVRIWLDAYQDSDLDDCTRVTYRLDDSFNKRVFASEDRKNFFEIKITIWGEFNVVAYIERSKGDSLIVTRYLDIPGSPDSVHRG
jgi:hypothetical protein